MATINKNEVIFFTNYYRANDFFDDTLRRLLTADYKVLVQYTGGNNLFGKPQLKHKNLIFKEISPTSYDGGMIEFKKSDILSSPEFKYLVHIDCDMFLSDIGEFEEYLSEFIDRDYDFAGHLVSDACCKRYSYGNGQLAHVDNMKIIPSSTPGDAPTPEPHYETSYMILHSRLWNKLLPSEVGHMRWFVAHIHNKGAKMAAHKASYRWDYSSWSKEWFHLGHIMSKYYLLESDTEMKLSPDSEFDLFRVGWLALHEEIYPDSMVFTHPKIRYRLDSLYNGMGGKEKALECFHRIAKGTCLENWKRYD